MLNIKLKDDDDNDDIAGRYLDFQIFSYEPKMMTRRSLRASLKSLNFILIS